MRVEVGLRPDLERVELDVGLGASGRVRVVHDQRDHDRAEHAERGRRHHQAHLAGLHVGGVRARRERRGDRGDLGVDELAARRLGDQRRERGDHVVGVIEDGARGARAGIERGATSRTGEVCMAGRVSRSVARSGDPSCALRPGAGPGRDLGAGASGFIATPVGELAAIATAELAVRIPPGVRHFRRRARA